MAQCTVVSNNIVSGNNTAGVASNIMYPTANTNHFMANKKPALEARRMEIISSKYTISKLKDNARILLLQHHLQDNSTNRSYQHDQLLFLNWPQQHHISDTAFSPVDLINFLVICILQNNIQSLQFFDAADFPLE